MRPHLLFLLTLPFLTPPALAQSPLPAGPTPPALNFPHFPTRLHTFVWRNWNLVDTDRLAKTVDTLPANIRACAASMGLRPEVAPPAAYRARLYLSVIRRNWHLLPYDQLLTLLDATPQQLAQTLRE